MNKIFKPLRLAFLILIFSNPHFLFSQNDTVEMADIMHENGKIYVVVAVISVILLGFLLALMSIDRRVRRIEKENKMN